MFYVTVFSQIASYLRPRDLLNLSRSSKHVRAVFLHRSSLAVWKRVLRKAGLPECPDDLVEPQYTSLVFDTNICMVILDARISCLWAQFLFIHRLVVQLLKTSLVTLVCVCDYVQVVGKPSTFFPLFTVVQILHLSSKILKCRTWRFILPIDRGDGCGLHACTRKRSVL